MTKRLYAIEIDGVLFTNEPFVLAFANRHKAEERARFLRSNLPAARIAVVLFVRHVGY